MLALEKSRAVSEQAREVRSRYDDARAAEARNAADRAAEERRLAQVEELELQWRRRAQAEGDLAQAWRDEQQKAAWMKDVAHLREEESM